MACSASVSLGPAKAVSHDPPRTLRQQKSSLSSWLLALCQSTARLHVFDHVQRGVSTLTVLSSFHTPSHPAHVISSSLGGISVVLAVVFVVPRTISSIIFLLASTASCAHIFIAHCLSLYNHFLYITVCSRGRVLAKRVGAMGKASWSGYVKRNIEMAFLYGIQDLTTTIFTFILGDGLC